MSFDLHVDATNWATGERASAWRHDFNYTSNVLPMIRLATGDPDIWTNGYQSDISRVLADMYGFLFPTWTRNRAAYLRLNPDNGWGSLDGLSGALKDWGARVDKFRDDDQGAVRFCS